MFTDTNIQHICDLVQDQFPAFYKEQGPDFIEFIKAYYEWLEQPDNPLGTSRNRYQQFDIDTASNEFLDHYRKKYMWGLPPELLGNQRLLQKHILELYRAKGSQQAIRLLFRLLYNEDIDFYIPSYDIFKLSDNTWIQPNYLEVTYSSAFDKLVGTSVTGIDSKATAIIENYESRYINGLLSHLLFVSNVRGTFNAGEKIINDQITVVEAPTIRGSVVGLQVTGSSPGMKIGDLMTATLGDKPVKVIVADTYDGTGSLRFVVEKPGSYYSLDATFIVKGGAHTDRLLPVANTPIAANSYGFPKDPLANASSIIGKSLYNLEDGDNVLPDDSFITGGGAEIRVLSLKDTFLYQYNSDLTGSFLNVPLDGTYPFPLNPDSNIATVIADSLSFETITVGSIDQVLVLNPGVNYSFNVLFQPIDPYTSTSAIKDSNNEFVGTNGLVVGIPIVGDNIVRTVKVHSSGYNNIESPVLSFTADANSDLTLTGLPIVGGVGWDEGYYDNTKSFLSDDKYLFDGHYYQDFSYVIRAARTLDKYIEILKKIAHPAGNAVYGDVKIVAGNRLYNKAVYAHVKSIVVATTAFDDGFDIGFE